MNALTGWASVWQFAARASAETIQPPSTLRWLGARYALCLDLDMIATEHASQQSHCEVPNVTYTPDSKK